jgi:hypothetical protein
MDAFHKAHANFPEGGTCLEFGVWKGITYTMQADVILNQYPKSALVGFDSWVGLPEETCGVWRPDRHAAGNYSCVKDVVLGNLATRNLLNDPRFRLIDGFFKDSLTKELQAEIKDLIFVNVDVDLYGSCVEVLEFIRPMFRHGTIIYFDDWKDPDDKYNGKWGEHLAWEEFTAKYPDVKYTTLEINKWNQRYMEIE